MSSYIFEKAREFLRDQKKKKIWYRLTTSMAALVVFITTYMLILPAITMEKELICGLEEHVHSDSCYGTQTRKVLNCDYDTLKVHTHTKECEDENGNLICMKADYLVHTHDAYCYDANGNLICTLPEIKEHKHEDSCYAQPTLVCGLAEQEGHVHGDSCYYTEEVLVCGNGTSVGGGELVIDEEGGETAHVHTADCWQTNLVLGCTIPESAGHYHSASCYAGGDTLICGYDKWEIKSHQHSESCYTEVTEQTNELVCGLEEHTHSDNCYEVKKEEKQDPQEVPELTTEIGGDSGETVTDSEPESDMQTDLGEADSTEIEAGQDETENESEPGTETVTVLAGLGVQADAVTLASDGTNADTDGETNTGDSSESSTNDESSSDEMVQVLTCTNNEENHEHNENCYISIQKSQLTCGKEAHEHEENCYDTGNNLICTMEEHTHTSECYNSGNDGSTEESTEPETQESEEPETQETIERVDLKTSTDITDISVAWHENERGTVTQQLYYQEKFYTVLSFKVAAASDNAGETKYYDVPLDPSMTGVEIKSDTNNCTAALSEDGTKLLIDVPSLADAADCSVKLSAYAAGETKVVFLNSEIPVTYKSLENASNYSINVKWMDASGTQVYSVCNGETYTVQAAFGIGADAFASAGIRTYSVIIDSAITDLEVTSATDGCRISSITENEDGTHTVILTVNGDTDGDGMYAQVDGILNISGTIDKQENQTQITLLGSSVPVSEKYTFTYKDESGLTAELSVVGGNYTPEEYELEVEKKDSDGYQTAISNFLKNEKQNAEEAYIYRVSLKNKSDGTEVSNINCSSYQLSMTWENGLYQKIYSSDTLTSAYAQNNGGNLSKMENGSFTLNDSGNVTGFSINRSGGLSSSDEYAFIRSTSEMLSYNEVKDAFITDPAYSKYYNSNSPIGTAGSFHLVAFDTANLSSHTNGNILAHTLKAGSNFGTNGYADELSYIQYYEIISGDSASDMDHVLVLGDSNEITVVDNGNHLAVNGTQINKPQNIVQDVDTANAPFIDLNRVKNEIQQISSNMASYNEAGLTYTSGAESGDEKNVLKLNNPNGVGVINLKASELNNKFGNYVQIDGFSSDCNGAVVINVDCTGMTNITMPEKALVVVDGEEQGTSEVVEFSNGKVIWNFVNAEGVTIEAHQMTGMIVAPGATVNIHKNLNGTVVADNINVMAESHRTDFTGKVTEPGEDEYYVTIKKIQTGYAGITLSGAEFDLYKYSDKEWIQVNTDSLVTDSMGVIALKELSTDTAYKLVETKAPEGYVLSNSAYVFWIPSSSTVKAPDEYPDDFSGDEIDIDETLLIANDKDTRTTTITLSIEKKWLNVKGESLSDVPVNRIAVKIYRSVEGSVEKSLYKTVYLTSFLGWKTTISDLPETVINEDGTTTKYVYTVEEVTVDGYKSTLDTASVVTADTEDTVVTETTVTLVNQQEGSYTFTKTDSANTSLKLPGATFTVYKADGTKVKDYVTGENGTFQISFADADENGNAVYEKDTAYYFVETAAPSGYVLPSVENLTKYYFYFSSEESTDIPTGCGENVVDLSTTNGTATGTNEREENTYDFTKVNNGSALPGATFSVYKRVVTEDSYTDTLVKTYTSGENGKFSISWKDGVYEADTLYYIMETAAPEGYRLDEETKYFFYFSSSSTTGDVPNGADENTIDLTTTQPDIVSWENEKKPNSYTFTKEDGFNSEIKLSGAKFQVFDADGNAIKDSKEAYLVYITDENGTFSINHTEEAFEYAYDTLYYIKEVEAPEGYVLSENPELYYFYFSKDTQGVPGGANVTAVDLSATEGSVVYKNDKEVHNYTFTKKDSIDSNVLLEGAEFTVYKYAKNSSDQFTEVAVTKYTTDAEGQFVISWTNGGDQNYKYEYDTGYYVVETKAPVQYELPEFPKKYYFYFSSPGTTSIPEGLEDQSPVNLSKTDGGENCINEKAVTDISVKKEWVNGTGESVNVQLYSSTTPPEAQEELPDSFKISFSISDWVDQNGANTSEPSTNSGIWINIWEWDSSINSVVNEDWNTKYATLNLYNGSWTSTIDSLEMKDSSGNVKEYYMQFGVWGDISQISASNGSVATSTVAGSYGVFSGTNGDLTISFEAVVASASATAYELSDISDENNATTTGMITNLLLPDNAAAVGESVTLSSDNNWQYTWDNLPEYDTDGNKLYYYVKETSTGSYSTNYTYEYINSSDWTQGIKLVTITNISTVPETTSFTVYKEWKGYETDVTTTYEVVVQLMQNGTAYGDEVVLDANSGWTYTWSELPTGHTYSVEEVAVRDKDSDNEISDSNYTKGYTVNEDGSVTITNTSNTGGYQLPETGGPGTQVFTWSGVVLTAFATILMYIKNKRRKEGHRTS